MVFSFSEGGLCREEQRGSHKSYFNSFLCWGCIRIELTFLAVISSPRYLSYCQRRSTDLISRRKNISWDYIVDCFSPSASHWNVSNPKKYRYLYHLVGHWASMKCAVCIHVKQSLHHFFVCFGRNYINFLIYNRTSMCNLRTTISRCTLSDHDFTNNSSHFPLCKFSLLFKIRELIEKFIGKHEQYVIPSKHSL